MSGHIRTVLITGAAKGIGRGCVAHLRRKGWRVAALDTDRDALEDLVSEEGASDLLPLVADVSDEDDVRRAVAGVSDWAGMLDLLVNNAGIADPVSGPVEDLALADWNRWIGTNLTGAFLMAKHAAPLLRRCDGAIVNIASTRALQSEPHCEAYAASKGGVLALTHALAVSFGSSIRVNAVAPGWIDVRGYRPGTDPATVPALPAGDHAQHPVGRVGSPEDVAHAVAYLAEAPFVTGETIVVDGGMTRKMIYVA